MPNFNLSSEVFFCKKIVSDAPLNIFNTSAKFGNWCLTPLRYLTDGVTLTISSKDGLATLNAKREFPQELNPTWGSGILKALKVAASIILLIPGTIIGSAFKGLSYASQAIRKQHHLAILHYTPMEDICLGIESKRLYPNQIPQEMAKSNPLNRQVNKIFVWLSEGSSIRSDYGLLAWKPSAIKFNGLRFIDGRDYGIGHKASTIRISKLAVHESTNNLKSFPNFACRAEPYHVKT